MTIPNCFRVFLLSCVLSLAVYCSDPSTAGQAPEHPQQFRIEIADGTPSWVHYAGGLAAVASIVSLAVAALRRRNSR